MQSHHLQTMYTRAFSLACCVMLIMLINQPAATEEYGLSTSGWFVPRVELKDCGAGLSTSQVGLEFSAGIFDLDYALTSYSWNTVSALPFGDEQSIPWQHLHEIGADAKYQVDSIVKTKKSDL